MSIKERHAVNIYADRCRFVPDGHFEITIWHYADTLATAADLD